MSNAPATLRGSGQAVGGRYERTLLCVLALSWRCVRLAFLPVCGLTTSSRKLAEGNPFGIKSIF
jgi:hypothetical protein